MSETYTIEYGDTLSELAVRFGTTVEKLKALNSLQIKNIDEIFDGQTIITSEPVQASLPETKQGKELSYVNLKKSLCDKTAGEKFVDVLFIPQMYGKHGLEKNKYLLITATAKKLVQSDYQACFAAMSQVDKNERVKQLSSLGLLDPFNSLAHETFLKTENPDSAEYYKKTLLLKLQLSTPLDKSLLELDSETIPYKFPKSDANCGLEHVNQSLQKIVEEKNRWIKDSQDFTQLKNWRKQDFNNSIDDKSFEVLKESQERFRRKSALDKYYEKLDELRQDLLDGVSKKCKEYEKKAIKIARNTQISNGDYKYNFISLGYYTSNKQANIYAIIKSINQYRVDNGIDDSLSSRDIDKNTVTFNLEQAYSIYKEFIGKFSSSKEIITNYYKNDCYEIAYRRKKLKDTLSFLDSWIGPDISDFILNVFKLNLSSTLVKEQCLTENELFELHTDVINVSEKIGSGISLASLKHELVKIFKQKKEMGYYPAYALNILLAKEISERISQFNKNVAENDNYSEWVRALLIYVRKTEEICEKWASKAKQASENPSYFYKIDGVENGLNFAEVEVYTQNNSSYQLIWNERNWQPEDVSDQIYTINSDTKEHIVECILLSDPSKLLYIRATDPILSNSPEEHKYHSAKYLINVRTSATGDGQIEPKSGEVFSYKGIGAEFTAAKFLKFDQTVGIGSFQNWDRMYSKKVNLFGDSISVDCSLAAQFMRFSVQNEGAVSLSGGKLEAKNESKFGIDLAGAQAGFKVKLPSDKKGWDLNIPYLKKYTDTSGIEHDNEPCTKDIGDFSIEIEGKLYGAIAASVHICSSLDVGNATSGVFGIKGSADQTLTTEPVSYETKAFAGVEAGGSLELGMNWLPPYSKDDSAFVNLAKVGGGMRVAAGIGGSQTFTMSFTNGRFIWIFDAKWASGVGIGGKIAGEMNPINIEQFFSTLIDIMQEKGFKRFNFIDENKDDTYRALNSIITVCIGMGLSISEAILLPFTIINSLEKKVTDKKNRYFVANFINSSENYNKNKEWIEKAPAETLANLFYVLAQYNDISIFDDKEEKNKAAMSNIAQSKAILTIFNWLGAGDNSVPTNKQISRFENAIQRMGQPDPTNIDKAHQWEFYVNNLLRIREFFRKCWEYDYERDSNVDNKYFQFSLINYQNFVKYIKKLVFNTSLYSAYDISSLSYVHENTFIALSNKSISNFKEIIWGGGCEYQFHEYKK